jgi:hypothetical protein
MHPGFTVYSTYGEWNICGILVKGHIRPGGDWGVRFVINIGILKGNIWKDKVQNQEIGSQNCMYLEFAKCSFGAVKCITDLELVQKNAC